MRILAPETDPVYNRLIKPSIKSTGLVPRRIDRVLHNKRIDQNIIAEPPAADIVPADLTLALRSVYLEGGVTEGQGVPVVYTCKRNHLAPRANDQFRHYRVHFDLR